MLTEVNASPLHFCHMAEAGLHPPEPRKAKAGSAVQGLCKVLPAIGTELLQVENMQPLLLVMYIVYGEERLSTQRQIYPHTCLKFDASIVFLAHYRKNNL